jgi:hypothetical protein
MTADEREDLEAEDVARASVPEEELLQAPDGADDYQRDDERRLTEEERAALLREQLKALHVIDVAQDMMLSLVTLGYQKLGLTEETEDLRNLQDARLAIDLLRSVIDVLAAAAGEPLVASFRSTLAAMQLNFARVAMPPADAAPRAAEETRTVEETRGEEDSGSPAGDPGAGRPAGANGEPGTSDQGG